MNLDKNNKQSQNASKDNKLFFKRLKSINTKSLDALIHPLHDQVFSNTNCLECANCCKTTSPVFTDIDISKISRYLNIRPSTFTERYLKIDTDNDYVLNSSHCFFLENSNHCSIYEVRPKAFRGFPHTNRKKQYQLLKLTKKNIDVCPAVAHIIERLKFLIK